MNKRGCSCWLELIVCVVLYKLDLDSSSPKFEFLLVKRDDGKWAIPGGIGASEITNNLFDFAAFEVRYDTDFSLLSNQLEQFKTIISNCGKRITIFFSYNIGKYTTVYEDGLRGEIFSLSQIIEMGKSDQIVFDNAKIIEEFVGIE